MKIIDAIESQVIHMGTPDSHRARSVLHSINHIATLLQISQIRRKGLRETFSGKLGSNPQGTQKVCVVA